MAPTAARSGVGTSWMASSGRPASARPRRNAAAIAREVRRLSEPPRRIAALPALTHSAPASAVTLGRLSKMTPMTPSGVATRSNVEAVRPGPLGEPAPDGIGQRGDVLDGPRHGLQARRRRAPACR